MRSLGGASSGVSRGGSGRGASAWGRAEANGSGRGLSIFGGGGRRGAAGGASRFKTEGRTSLRRAGAVGGGGLRAAAGGFGGPCGPGGAFGWTAGGGGTSGRWPLRGRSGIAGRVPGGGAEVTDLKRPPGSPPGLRSSGTKATTGGGFSAGPRGSFTGPVGDRGATFRSAGTWVRARSPLGTVSVRRGRSTDGGRGTASRGAALSGAAGGPGGRTTGAHPSTRTRSGPSPRGFPPGEAGEPAGSRTTASAPAAWRRVESRRYGVNPNLDVTFAGSPARGRERRPRSDPPPPNPKTIPQIAPAIQGTNPRATRLFSLGSLGKTSGPPKTQCPAGQKKRPAPPRRGAGPGKPFWTFF